MGGRKHTVGSLAAKLHLPEKVVLDKLRKDVFDSMNQLYGSTPKSELLDTFVYKFIDGEDGQRYFKRNKATGAWSHECSKEDVFKHMVDLIKLWQRYKDETARKSDYRHHLNNPKPLPKASIKRNAPSRHGSRESLLEMGSPPFEWGLDTTHERSRRRISGRERSPELLPDIQHSDSDRTELPDLADIFRESRERRQKEMERSVQVASPEPDQADEDSTITITAAPIIDLSSSTEPPSTPRAEHPRLANFGLPSPPTTIRKRLHEIEVSDEYDEIAEVSDHIPKKKVRISDVPTSPVTIHEPGACTHEDSMACETHVNTSEKGPTSSTVRVMVPPVPMSARTPRYTNHIRELSVQTMCDQEPVEPQATVVHSPQAAADEQQSTPDQPPASPTHEDRFSDLSPTAATSGLHTNTSSVADPEHESIEMQDPQTLQLNVEEQRQVVPPQQVPVPLPAEITPQPAIDPVIQSRDGSTPQPYLPPDSTQYVTALVKVESLKMKPRMPFEDRMKMINFLHNHRIAAERALDCAEGGDTQMQVFEERRRVLKYLMQDLGW